MIERSDHVLTAKEGYRQNVDTFYNCLFLFSLIPYKNGGYDKI